MWLAPQNAALWLDAIAEVLSESDPSNAAIYRENAETGRAVIAEAGAEIEGLLDDAAPGSFVVYHDAFQYFEYAFGLETLGSLALSDARPPSAARVAKIRSAVAGSGVACAFSEPQFDPRLVDTVFGQDSGVQVAVLDPLGSALTSGPGLYPALIGEIGRTIADCVN